MLRKFLVQTWTKILELCTKISCSCPEEISCIGIPPLAEAVVVFHTLGACTCSCGWVPEPHVLLTNLPTQVEMCLVTGEKHIQDLFADTLAWFVQKNPFRIHKLCTDLCSMARKSNMKVHNTSTHPVKGRNPYCSRWPTHNYQSKLIRSAIFVISPSDFFYFFKQLFGPGRFSFWLILW